MKYKFIFLFGLVLILLSSFVNSINVTDLNNGIITDYTFDNDNISGTTVLDSTPNANSGTLNSGTLSGQTGILNEAIYCDGINDNVITNSIVADITTNSIGTIAYWVKSSTMESGSASRVTFGDTNVNEAFAFNAANGFIQFDIIDSGTRVSNGKTASIMSNDVWYFVAMTQDGTTAHLYLNGEEQSIIWNTQIDKSAWFDRLSGIDNGRICTLNFQSLGNYYFSTGFVDEVMYFDYNLSEEELLFLYANKILTSDQQYEFSTPVYPTLTIKANNSHTGEFLTNFTMTLPNGTTYQNQTGTELYFYNITETLNASFSKYLYFNTSQVIDFNQTATVIVEMRPTASQITFDDFVKDEYDNSTIQNFTAQFHYIEGGLTWNVSTTNGSLGVIRTVHNSTINHSGLHVNGTHNITIWGTSTEGIPYYVQSKIYVVPDADTSYNETFYLNLSNARLVFNQKFRSYSNVTLNNFSLEINGIDNLNTYEYNSTNGSITAYVNWNGYYNVTIKPDGYEYKYLNISSDSNYIQEDLIYFYTTNSISFSIYDLNSLSLTSSLVNIELLGETATYYESTSNGTLYVDSLNDDIYKITFSSSSYDSTILFVTLEDNTHSDVIVYMKNGSNVNFIVTDQDGDAQGNATLTFIQTINGSQITIGQAKTDFSGRASIYLDETIEYSFFVVKDGFNTFTGKVTPTQSEYTIVLEREGDTRFISIFEDLLLQTNFNYAPLSGYAEANLILNSPAGALSYYGMSTTYNSVNYFINTTGIPAGGVETFNITGIDTEVQPTITITYFFKYGTRDLQTWNNTYLMSDIVPANITLDSGLFDDVRNLDRNNPMRGIIGAFVVLGLILIFSFSRDVTITAISGLIGLAIDWKFELMPKSILTVCMIVVGVLIVADNIGGGR